MNINTYTHETTTVTLTARMPPRVNESQSIILIYIILATSFALPTTCMDVGAEH